MPQQGGGRHPCHDGSGDTQPSFGLLDPDIIAEEPWRYEKWARYAEARLSEMFVEDFDFVDNWSILVGAGQGPYDIPRDLLFWLEDFEVQHVGCSFIRELEGDVQISRSFLMACMENGVQRYSTVHLEIREPHRRHLQEASERLPEIVSFEVYRFVLGFPGSNAILRTHILPERKGESCRRILALMEGPALNQVREELLDVAK